MGEKTVEASEKKPIGVLFGVFIQSTAIDIDLENCLQLPQFNFPESV